MTPIISDALCNRKKAVLLHSSKNMPPWSLRRFLLPGIHTEKGFKCVFSSSYGAEEEAPRAAAEVHHAYMARSEEVAFAGLAHLRGGFKHAAARSSSNKIVVSYFYWVAHSCTIAPTMNLPFLLNAAFALSLLASPALSRTVYPWQQTMTGDALNSKCYPAP